MPADAGPLSTPLWITILASGSGWIAAGMSLLIMRWQLKSKEKELDRQADLKAREMIFGLYQKHSESVMETARRTMKALDDSVRALGEQFANDVPQLKTRLARLLELQALPLIGVVSGLLNQATTLGMELSKETLELAHSLREELKKNMEGINPEEGLEKYQEIVIGIPLIYEAYNIMMSEYCEQLFRVHIQPSKSDRSLVRG